MSISKAYDDNDAVGLGEVVDRGAFLEEAIERTERLNPQLNAVVIEMYDEARRRIDAGLPQGPLRGVPFLLKDLVASYAGVPLRSGSRAFADHVPSEHSEIVRRYLATGLVVFGKTNTSEWGILPTVETELYGPCHNPWKLGVTTGGSSGGAAAAVAARIVPVAHGGDAGGSIRISASFCGVFGLKPTRGRNPLGPDQSERAHGLGAEHVVSLSVRDSAAFLDASAGPEDTAPYWAPPKTSSYADEVNVHPGRLRIAFTSEPLLPADEHPECRAAVKDAAKLLADLGHHVEEAHPRIDAHATARAFFTIYCSGVAGEVVLSERSKRPIRPEDVEPTTWLMSMIGRHVLSAGEMSAAIRELQEVARHMHRFHRTYDVFLTPTLGKPPVAHGVLGPQGMEKRLHEAVAKRSMHLALKLPGLLDKAVARAYAFAPFTPIGNVTGQPGMSVPLFWSAESSSGDATTLFRLGRLLALPPPWRDVRPPVCS